MSKACQGLEEVWTLKDKVLYRILSTSKQDGFLPTMPGFLANGSNWSGIWSSLYWVTVSENLKPNLWRCLGKPWAVSAAVTAESTQVLNCTNLLSTAPPVPWPCLLPLPGTPFKLWTIVFCHMDLWKLQETPYEGRYGKINKNSKNQEILLLWQHESEIKTTHTRNVYKRAQLHSTISATYLSIHPPKTRVCHSRTCKLLLKARNYCSHKYYPTYVSTRVFQ